MEQRIACRPNQLVTTSCCGTMHCLVTTNHIIEHRWWLCSIQLYIPACVAFRQSYCTLWTSVGCHILLLIPCTKGRFRVKKGRKSNLIIVLPYWTWTQPSSSFQHTMLRKRNVFLLLDITWWCGLSRSQVCTQSTCFKAQISLKPTSQHRGFVWYVSDMVSYSSNATHSQ